MSETTAYRNIIKSGSLFGMVQIANIVIALIRSKCLAIFIGPMGYGIFGLLNSTIDMVRMATGFGMEISSVKHIAEISNDSPRILQVKASAVIKLAIATGIAGALTAIFFSKYLSIWTFKNTGMTVPIICISVSIIMQQLTFSHTAIMQGMNRFKYLAKTNLYGNIGGLLLTLPLYYFLGIDAIVPAIIITALFNLLISVFFYKKLNIAYTRISFNETLAHGREILHLGSLLALSSFLPVFSNFVIQIFISNMSSVSTVGLFTIGMAMVNSYVGILFTAMSAEYFPRLASISKDNYLINKAVNQQAIIAMLAIIPIIIFFLGYSPLVVKVLLSAKFNEVIPMLSWAVAAMFFKAVSFTMGYVIIAKGDSKVFIRTAVFFNSVYILFCITGFYYGSLEGLGIALFIYYASHLIIIGLISCLRYRISFGSNFVKVFISGFMLCLLGIVISRMYFGSAKHIIFLILLLVSIVYSYKEIDKLIFIKSMLKDLLKKKNK
ncbi:hypothetical protein CHU92_13960 [Flavobacterium cyanobacteriorum]|uniref:O-antigen translocase n=1 Tax=Flavobacterium cyanobacteriorum TaxID=2022802 RepID=A0A255YV22_9FLAO|nr:oligosaccharide flippase family protein [Flavobacterium cyanobacteriorum]OYQ33021.1 hypothetical protein CHU92_13960 [Flavobacterium cyanobacteriorum]